jgi:membrane protein required for colicin V production
MSAMTLFDYAVLVAIALSMLVGVWRGVVSELLALVAWVAAFIVAREYAAQVAPSAAPWIADAGLRMAAVYAGLFVAVLIGFTVLRLLASLMISAVGLGLLDRLLGGVFGALRGIGVVLLGVMLAGVTPLPNSSTWRESMLAPPLETVVIAGKRWMPSDLAARIKYHR